MTEVTSKSIDKNKSSYVNEIFTNIATKYDLLNNLMTFGMHYKWKREAVKLALNEITKVKTTLDLCSGTGDMGIILKELNQNIKITMVDNCDEMINISRKKINRLHLEDITIVKSNIDDISYPPCTFDIVTIGFGLRNLEEREKCIEKVYELLTNGGVFCIIDLSYPQESIFKNFILYYFFNVIPKLGGMFAKNKAAYTYLVKSLHTWYKQEELKEIILKKGFKKCFYKNILGGMIAIHIALK